MAKQVVDIGQAPNDGTGDPLRIAMDKLNDNFNEVYRSLAGLGNNTVLNLIDDEGEALDVTGVFNKVSFLLNDESELYALNPANYHGCVAHVHSTGALYYAHGEWRKLLSDNANNDITSYADSLANVAYTGNLLDLGISDGIPNSVLTTDGSGNFSFLSAGGGGGAAANTFGTIVVSGQSNVVADSTTDILTFEAGDNVTLTTNANTDTIIISANVVSSNTGGGGTGGFTPTRVTQAVTSASIADDAAADISFANLGISYVLYSIAVDKGAMVRIYNNTSSRSNDSRAQGVDPVEGDGVIAEFISNGANTFTITPGVFGYVDNSETSIPVEVTNLSGTTGTVAVTLTGLKLEDA